MAPGDSRQLRDLADAVRDEATLHPSADGEEYDDALPQTWGGPRAPRWYAAALEVFASDHSANRGRRALVTGGGSGIGFYVAKLLAAVGMAVILPCRPALEHEAYGAAEAIRKAVPGAAVEVPPLPLDLASFASVNAFAAHMRANGSAIDVLGLNAGRGGSDADPIVRTADAQEITMQVNYLSHALLVHELLPVLRKSSHVRIVAHTSSARNKARPSDFDDLAGRRWGATPWHLYSTSKAALCMLAKALNPRLARAGVRGVALVADPGLAATGVNVQHDLARVLGLHRRGIKDTKAFHDAAAVHAADAALPMALAALEGHADALYVGDGPSATSLEAAAHRAGHLLWQDVRREDPMLWSEAEAERLWTQTWKILDPFKSDFSWESSKDEL